jgi:hypothetical protein
VFGLGLLYAATTILGLLSLESALVFKCVILDFSLPKTPVYQAF